MNNLQKSSVSVIQLFQLFYTPQHINNFNYFSKKCININYFDYEAFYVKTTGRSITIYRRTYSYDNNGEINKDKYTDVQLQSFPIAHDGYMQVNKKYTTLRNVKTQTSVHKKTEFFNYSRVSDTVIGMFNTQSQYKLTEGTKDGVPYFDYYLWNSSNKIGTFNYQLY